MKKKFRSIRTRTHKSNQRDEKRPCPLYTQNCTQYFRTTNTIEPFDRIGPSKKCNFEMRFRKIATMAVNGRINVCFMPFFSGRLRTFNCFQRFLILRNVYYRKFAILIRRKFANVVFPFAIRVFHNFQ